MCKSIQYIFGKPMLMSAGDSFNSSLVAVVSVDPDVLKEWATSEGIKVIDLLILCKR